MKIYSEWYFVYDYIWNNEGVPEFITVIVDDKPKWFRLVSNSTGQYVVINGHREYVFINNITE